MKVMKRNSLLALLFCFAGALTMAACGGADKDNTGTSGEQGGVEVASQEEWNSVFENSFMATNVTMNVDQFYEHLEPEYIYREKTVGWLKTADGNIAMKTTETVWGEDETETTVINHESYYFNERGIFYCLDWNDTDKKWEITKDSDWTLEYANGWGLAQMFVRRGFEFDYESLYEKAVFDDKLGVYVCGWTDEYEVAWELELQMDNEKISAFKVSSTTYTGEQSIEASVTSRTISAVVTYGDTEITLPKIEQDGPVGDVTIKEVELPNAGQVDAEEFAAAMSAMEQADSFKMKAYFSGYVVGSSPSELVIEGAGTSQVDDNKAMGSEYVNEKGYYGTYRKYSYIGNVNGINYVWDSVDGENWVTYERGPAVTINGAWMLEGLDALGLDFNEAVYDETTGGYKFVLSETASVIVGVANRHVVFLIQNFQREEEHGLIAYTYKYAVDSYNGSGYVGQLPPLNIGGDDKPSDGGSDFDMPDVDVVYQIVYGNTAEITLPTMDKEEPELPGGGDVEIPDTEGEQIKDAETWNAVWEKSYDADNLVAISTYEEDGEFESVNIQITDGKYYEVFRDESAFKQMLEQE